MERPSTEVLDCFYKLCDYNSHKRINAAKELLQNEETLKFKDYVLDRLLKGLPSGKSDCRLGYSTALSALLYENPELISADEFLKLIDEKMSLKVSKKERTANALGQHLAFVAVYSAAAFHSSLRKIIKRHVSLLDEMPQLQLPFSDAVLLILTNYKTETNPDVLPSADLLELLKLIETIETNNAELHGYFSRELVSSLDEQSYIAFAKKAFNKEPWYYNRLVVSFGRRSIDTKRQLFELLANLPEKTSGTFGATCSLIERLFKLNYHKTQIQDVRIKPEDEELILGMFPAVKGKKKKNSDKGVNRNLQILASTLQFIQKAANDPDEIEQYKEDAEEAQKLAETPASECSKALLELCLSLNSRKLRLCRTLVLFVTTKEHRLFETEHIKLAMGDDGDEEMDDEFKPITEEERQQVLAKWAAEEGNEENIENISGEDSDVSMETDTEDDEEDLKVKPDPKLAKDLKSALGKMAFDDSESDNGPK
ncbi:hypothetical protein M3Y97_00500200 [Aphelenchoides bicaudatus]|nr:hypothetical protein M3Y97_00500200 [Aphelenchoides bicaudatus]